MRRAGAAQLDQDAIAHVSSRGDDRLDRHAAALELQMRIDRADHEALSVGERGQLQGGLGSCECFQRRDILQIGGERRAPR